ncbi:GGDEF domain-containing protein [Peteryoungia desertarenae]|uniref:diguanylate cyclase n=1 Tax=Peteryoungia desertarenae TaxID=1813451 RepID=A0ABX6QNR1_9HYPH|nr:GGDEF domain-containing protein [Peteryoungia desertarenae]QLF70092.1 GGDEF domain-containing protein [Peteryoungia desertarenae]
MIDVKTGFLLWITQAATFAILLGAIWSRDRTQRHYLWFALGFAVHSIGLSLVVLREDIADFLSIQIGNLISLLAFSCWINGMLLMGDRKPSSVGLMPSTLWIAANLIPAIAGDMGLRMGVYHFASAFGFCLLASVALRLSVSSSFYRRSLAAVWGCQAIACLGFAMTSVQLRPDSFADVNIGTPIAISGFICFVAAITIILRMLMDRSQEQLQVLVRTDPLTGLLNRRGFIEAFESLRSRPGTSSIALLLFDLDHFKSINDTHGHGTGDGVLQHFARIGRALLPDVAAFGRTGGEEFAAAIPVTEARDAALIAETVRQALADRGIDLEDRELVVTTSIGIAVMPRADADLDKLMTSADRALYKAKTQGRNRTAVSTGERILQVPSARPDALDDQADRQVAILRRLAAAAPNLNHSRNT